MGRATRAPSACICARRAIGVDLAVALPLSSSQMTALATFALDLICVATDINEFRFPSHVPYSPMLAVHPSGFHALPATPIRSAPPFIFGNRVGVNLGV